MAKTSKYKEITGTNLIVNGSGHDANGNYVAKFNFPNQRSFSIQTGGSLNETEKILKGDKLKDVTEANLLKIKEEIVSYLQAYGSRKQKKSLKIFSTQEMEQGGNLEYKKNDEVDFYYGRDKVRKSGTIAEILPTGKYAISTGMSTSSVDIKDIIGYTEKKKKKFGIFEKGGNISGDFIKTLRPHKYDAPGYNPFGIPVYENDKDNVFVFIEDIEPVWLAQNEKRAELNKIAVQKTKEYEKLRQRKRPKSTKAALKLMNDTSAADTEMDKAISEAQKIVPTVMNIVPRTMSLVYNPDGSHMSTWDLQEKLIREHGSKIYHFADGGNLNPKDNIEKEISELEASIKKEEEDIARYQQNVEESRKKLQELQKKQVPSAWYENLTAHETSFVVDALNRYGHGNHPKAESGNLKSFKPGYVREVLNKINDIHMNQTGLKLKFGILDKLN